MNKIFAVFIGLFFLCMLSEAQSFDVDGFKSGMSKKEIKEIVASWNFDTVQETDDSILAYDKPTKGSHRFYQFVFCNNKLDYLQKEYEPSIKNFILLFNKLSSIYGTKVNGHSDIAITSIGEHRFISLTWEQSLENITLIYDTLPTNDNLTVRYKVISKCKM